MPSDLASRRAAANVRPSEGMLDKIFSRKKKRKGDIELPNESGKRDSRLPTSKLSFMEKLKANKEALNPLDRAGSMLGKSLAKAKKQKR